MPSNPAALKAELAETQGADAALVVITLKSMGATPEQVTWLADKVERANRLAAIPRRSTWEE